MVLKRRCGQLSNWVCCSSSTGVRDLAMWKGSDTEDARHKVTGSVSQSFIASIAEIICVIIENLQFQIGRIVKQTGPWKCSRLNALTCSHICLSLRSWLFRLTRTRRVLVLAALWRPFLDGTRFELNEEMGNQISAVGGWLNFILETKKKSDRFFSARAAIVLFLLFFVIRDVLFHKLSRRLPAFVVHGDTSLSRDAHAAFVLKTRRALIWSLWRVEVD